MYRGLNGGGSAGYFGKPEPQRLADNVIGEFFFCSLSLSDFFFSFLVLCRFR